MMLVKSKVSLFLGRVTLDCIHCGSKRWCSRMRKRCWIFCTLLGELLADGRDNSTIFTDTSLATTAITVRLPQTVTGIPERPGTTSCQLKSP